MTEKKIPSRFYYNKGGIVINYDLTDGSDEYAQFGMVATGHFNAPGKGLKAVEILHRQLQEWANTFGVNISDLVEPETADGKRFFTRLRQEGKLYQEEEYVDDIRYLIERFYPRK